eukprot:CFRG2391T1
MAKVIDWNKPAFFFATSGMIIGGLIGVHFLEERAVQVKELWATSFELEIEQLEKEIEDIDPSNKLLTSNAVKSVESNQAVGVALPDTHTYSHVPSTLSSETNKWWKFW